jgi:hypothetical protein
VTAFAEEYRDMLVVEMAMPWQRAVAARAVALGLRPHSGKPLGAGRKPGVAADLFAAGVAVSGGDRNDCRLAMSECIGLLLAMDPADVTDAYLSRQPPIE